MGSQRVRRDWSYYVFLYNNHNYQYTRHYSKSLVIIQILTTTLWCMSSYFIRWKKEGQKNQGTCPGSQGHTAAGPGFRAMKFGSIVCVTKPKAWVKYMGTSWSSFQMLLTCALCSGYVNKPHLCRNIRVFHTDGFAHAVCLPGGPHDPTW